MRNIYCRKYPQCHLLLFRSHPHFIKCPHIPNCLIMGGLYCLSIMFNLSVIILLNLIIYNCLLCCCNVFIIVINVLHNFSTVIHQLMLHHHPVLHFHNSTKNAHFSMKQRSPVSHTYSQSPGKFSRGLDKIWLRNGKLKITGFSRNWLTIQCYTSNRGITS